jgi:Na+/proline symporter
VTALDWTVLIAALALFVAYGSWRGRGTRDLESYLLAGRSLRGPAVALTVMATQASAITFLSTPGQGFVDGLRFVQFYFGLPLAMVVLCVSAIPAYRRLRVFTAYEYLERRFDRKTRVLASLLFLVQRGLAAGLTLYAPALVLSVVLGWEVRWTCVLIGALVAAYTSWGGSRAVSHAHALQFLIILATLVLIFALLIARLPAGVGWLDATALAGRLGRLDAVHFRFDPNDRYNLWSGLIGGFFLQLSYFGTDQSQVGRYLTGSSTTASRMGLLYNGLFKIPMQFAILFLGVMVFALDLFAPSPLSFNPLEVERMSRGARATEWAALEQRYAGIDRRLEQQARALVAARHARDRAAERAAGTALEATERSSQSLRAEAARLISAADPGAPASDTNYIFLAFVRRMLPAGVVGLALAAIFAASMNSTSAEMNALTSTTVVDVLRRRRERGSDSPARSDRGPAGDRGGGSTREVWISRLITIGWTMFAVGFADLVSRLGSLIEAVNILGSLFYGTILGIFLTAFFLPRVRGTAVFVGALVAEAVVVACFRFTHLSFLWYNVIGCAVVMVAALALTPLTAHRAAGGARE